MSRIICIYFENKRIKVFKLQRWCSYAGYMGEPAWEKQEKMYFTKKEAIAKADSIKAGYTAPYNKVKILGEMMDVKKIIVKAL